MYITYLTIYCGEKLPPFYIGSSTLKKINNGYRGSVASKRYGKIFKEELKLNNELFDVVVLSEHETRIQALEMELFLQKKFDVVNSELFFNESYASINGYFGRDVSGTNNPMYGKKQTEEAKKIMAIKRGHEKRYEITNEHKKIISEAHKNKYVSKETRDKISAKKKGIYIGENASFFGKKHTEETKRKISDKNKGRIMSNEEKEHLSKINKGKVFSDEVRKKISESKKGKKRFFSEKWRHNISNANKGRVVSEETKIKLKLPRNSPKSICPHCGLSGGGGNMKRYHFDNCKHKNNNNEK